MDHEDGPLRLYKVQGHNREDYCDQGSWEKSSLELNICLPDWLTKRSDWVLCHGQGHLHCWWYNRLHQDACLLTCLKSKLVNIPSPLIQKWTCWRSWIGCLFWTSHRTSFWSGLDDNWYFFIGDAESCSCRSRTLRRHGLPNFIGSNNFILNFSSLRTIQRRWGRTLSWSAFSSWFTRLTLTSWSTWTKTSWFASWVASWNASRSIIAPLWRKTLHCWRRCSYGRVAHARAASSNYSHNRKGDHLYWTRGLTTLTWAIR